MLKNFPFSTGFPLSPAKTRDAFEGGRPSRERSFPLPEQGYPGSLKKAFPKGKEKCSGPEKETSPGGRSKTFSPQKEVLPQPGKRENALLPVILKKNKKYNKSPLPSPGTPCFASC